MQQRQPRVRLHVASRSSMYLAPSDTCNIIECIFVLLGTGYMLSYNVLITPIDFYDAIYSSYTKSIMYYIVPIHRIFLLLSIFLMITPCFTYSNYNNHNQQTRSSSKIPWHLLITIPFLMIFISLCIYPYFPQFISETSKDESVYFVILLIICSFCGFFSGIIQCAVTAFCNYLPSQYMKASISGQAMAGIIVCFVKICIKINDDKDYRLDGKIYFMIGGVFHIFCAILFIGVKKTKLSKYYLNYHQNKAYQDNCTRYRAIKFNSKSTQKLVDKKIKEKKSQQKAAIKMYAKSNSNHKMGLLSAQNKANVAVQMQPHEYRKNNNEDEINYFSVFQEINSLSVATFIVMMVTFLYFPGLLISIKSQYEIFQNDDQWFAIILVTEYNIFDYFGRQFLSKYPLFINPQNVVIIAVIRCLIVYPAFFVLYQEYIISDIMLHVVNAFGALSNGYLICLLFIFLNERSQMKKMSANQSTFNHISATIMTLALNIGILCGSLLAILIQKYVL